MSSFEGMFGGEPSVMDTLGELRLRREVVVGTLAALKSQTNAALAELRAIEAACPHGFEERVVTVGQSYAACYGCGRKSDLRVWRVLPWNGEPHPHDRGPDEESDQVGL